MLFNSLCEVQAQLIMWKFDSTFGLFLTIKTTHITTNNMSEHDAAVLAKQVKDLTKTLEFYKTLINQIDIELGGGGRKGADAGRWNKLPIRLKNS
jgi:hypothetical protein